MQKFLKYAAFAAMVLASAGKTIAAEPLESVSSHLRIDGVASQEERELLQSLIQTSNDLLASPHFEENLLSLEGDYPEIFANPEWQAVSMRRLTDIVALREPGLTIIPVPVALFGSEAYSDNTMFNYVARTGSTHFNGIDLPGAMSIGRVNMYRYRQNDVVDKSCAINTITHERLHQISRSPDKFDHAIADTFANKRTNTTLPLASYLVGAVAQCTWLQEQGRVPSGGLKSCVQVFGTQNFNNERCSQFVDGQDVVDRKGLAKPAEPL
ncbi:hypothetical protein ABI_12630 [Asticcacaulis biprosthecium C19]|uniref:Uncharacterized protein n=1 Tax=Asticcacaulis biprosthecium C19 TaxID=715226 RepID=F4QHT8_9CAUL|nr:hypothetical protein [Asticcacaulis biprosthecium]EGF92825.1 hypothetical protein ABI_12630 [Asticcacaulis biprosthecium C19]